MPFERTAFPGVSIYGRIQAGKQAVDLDTPGEWRAQINDSILFPTGLIDDVFLHVGVGDRPLNGCAFDISDRSMNASAQLVLPSRSSLKHMDLRPSMAN